MSMEALARWKPGEIPHVVLTQEDRRKFARHALLCAYSAWGIAQQMMEMGGPGMAIVAEANFNEAMRWLETARDVWPLEGDGDSINIEQILNGRVP